MAPVELIPGTALPFIAPSMAPQPEGRGGVQLTDERQPPPMVEGSESGDLVPDSYRQIVDAALRAFDRSPKFERTVFDGTAGQTDATTGNLVLELFQIPMGTEGRIVNVTIDLPSSATITPAAPYANAASWCFLASLGSSTGLGNANPALLRSGMVAFAPTSAAGPILPGQWTFNEDECPVIWGGMMLFFVLVGGSVAAITNQQLEASYRVNLYSHR